MYRTLFAVCLFVSTSAFAQFDSHMQKANPKSTQLLNLNGKTLSVANRQDLEHPDMLGKHQTFFYPSSIRSIGKHSHEVAIEMRQNQKVVLRQLWQIDCRQPHFAVPLATANFAQKKLYDETVPSKWAKWRHSKGDLSLDLDYQSAVIHGTHAFVQTACTYIQK